jgi:hypothetical protein
MKEEEALQDFPISFPSKGEKTFIKHQPFNNWYNYIIVFIVVSK